jgi:hypothetical protein
VRVRWTSQREINLVRWIVERAPAVANGPGTFASIHELPVGSQNPQIHGVPNRHPYEYLDAGRRPGRHRAYWYRLRWVDTYGNAHTEPALSVRIQDSPTIARVRYSWTHNYSDGDLAVRLGTGTSTSAPAWFRRGSARRRPTP